MRTGKIVSMFIGLSFLGSALAYAFWPAPREPIINEPPVAMVNVMTVTSEGMRREIRFSGITRAEKEAVLSFSVPARMVQRPVKIGDRVSKGDVLARLDSREFDYAVAKARARVAETNVRLIQAKRERHRFKRLADKKVASTEEYEQADTMAGALEASLQAAEAQRREALRLLSEAILRAPFTGTITAVHLEPGEWAAPGSPVVEMSGDENIELEVEVPESVIGQLREDDNVHVVLPFMGDQRLEGRVTSMAQAATSSGRLFPVVVALDSIPGLMAGMTAELILEVRSAPMPVVPVGAIVNPGSSRPSVFVLDKERVKEIFVELGPFHGDSIAVSGMLTPGDRVVISGHTSLSNGRKVKAQS